MPTPPIRSGKSRKGTQWPSAVSAPQQQALKSPFTGGIVLDLPPVKWGQSSQ